MVRSTLPIVLLLAVSLLSKDVSAQQRQTQTTQTTPTSTIALTNDNIHSAVRLWLDSANNNRTLVEALYGGSIGDWDISGVTVLDEVFADLPRGTSLTTSNTSDGIISLARWDTSRVTSMRALFYNTTGFSAPGLDAWDVSSVQDMRVMWAYATDFASDVSPWNTASLQTVRAALAHYSHTTVRPTTPTEESMPMISTWKTPSLTDMEGLFTNTQFVQTNLEGWTTSQVTNMAFMFEESRNFYGGDLSVWDVSKVVTMEHMFAGAINLRGARDIATTWDTSRVQSMDRIFYNTTINYGDPDDPVPDDADLFYLCWDVTSLSPNINNGTADGLDQAFCHSNAGGFNCACLPDTMVDRVNTGCNTTRKTCFHSLSSAGDLADTTDSSSTSGGVPNLVDSLGDSTSGAISTRVASSRFGSYHLVWFMSIGWVTLSFVTQWW